MDNPIHVEVEVVELDGVGIGLAGVDGDRDPVDDDGLLLDDVDHDHRVLLGQPSVERGHAHLGNPEQSRGSRIANGSDDAGREGGRRKKREATASARERERTETLALGERNRGEIEESLEVELGAREAGKETFERDAVLRLAVAN